MTIRETTIAKLQQLPEPLLQEVSDFIDFLRDKQQHSKATDKPNSDVKKAWLQWFESVDRLEVSPNQPASNYQQLLLTKYRKQGRDIAKSSPLIRTSCSIVLAITIPLILFKLIDSMHEAAQELVQSSCQNR